jgi:hypothetical protein
MPLHVSAIGHIEDLMSCYAYGSDAIGRAVNATIQVPPPFDGTDANIHEDPNFAEGLRLYRKCFAEDWILAVEINGVPFELPPGSLRQARWRGRILSTMAPVREDSGTLSMSSVRSAARYMDGTRAR